MTFPLPDATNANSDSSFWLAVLLPASLPVSPRATLTPESSVSFIDQLFRGDSRADFVSFLSSPSDGTQCEFELYFSLSQTRNITDHFTYLSRLLWEHSHCLDGDRNRLQLLLRWRRVRSFPFFSTSTTLGLTCLSLYSTQKCGGTYRINVYQQIASTTTTTTTSVPAATATSSLYTSLGCYADPNGNRQLTGASSTSASMSESRGPTFRTRTTKENWLKLISRFELPFQRPICAPPPASAPDTPTPELSVSFLASLPLINSC